MNYKGCFIKIYSLNRVVTLLLLSALLSSCASMQQRSGSGSSSSSGDRQSVQEQNASTSSEGSIPGTVSAGLQQEELDPGINRVGRVIQLGMFAEERPQVEVPEGTTVELNLSRKTCVWCLNN